MPKSSLPELVLIEDNGDDEELSLTGIRKSGIPCNVTVLRDGAEALELLLRQTAVPALIILDYNLPKYDGLRVLTRLRAHGPTQSVPVVIFSGTNCGSGIEQCYRAGANSCVTKPVEASEYVSLLNWITYYWLRVNRSPEDTVRPFSYPLSEGSAP